MPNKITLSNRQAASRKNWIRVVIVAFFVAGFIVFLSLNSAHKDGNQTTSSEPSASASATAGVLNKTQKEQISATTADSVASVVANSIKSQFSKDTGVLDNIGSDQKYSDSDATGNPAKVSIIQFSNVPNTYDYKKNIKELSDYVKSDAVSGNWVSEEATPDSDTATILRSVRLYDKNEDASNPAIIEVSYLEQNDNNPDKNITVIITASVY
jgi:hypothetical protein